MYCPLLFMQQIPTDLAGDNNTGNILPATGRGQEYRIYLSFLSYLHQ